MHRRFCWYIIEFLDRLLNVTSEFRLPHWEHWTAFYCKDAPVMEHIVPRSSMIIFHQKTMRLIRKRYFIIADNWTADDRFRWNCNFFVTSADTFASSFPPVNSRAPGSPSLEVVLSGWYIWTSSRPVCLFSRSRDERRRQKTSPKISQTRPSALAIARRQMHRSFPSPRSFLPSLWGKLHRDDPRFLLCENIEIAFGSRDR